MPLSPTPFNNAPIQSQGRTPPPKKSGGPIVGVVIVLVLLIFGAFYVWGARLNNAGASADQVPYIPAGTTTLPDINQQ